MCIHIENFTLKSTTKTYVTISSYVFFLFFFFLEIMLKNTFLLGNKKKPTKKMSNSYMKIKMV